MSDQNETTETTDSEVKTFTQQEVDRIVSERLARVKSQFADYDDLKSRAEAADNLQNQVEELNGKLTEADKRASDAELSSLRVKVSAEHGVPLSALTGSDEESLVEQAKGLVDWKTANTGVKREAENSGNSSGPAKDAKARAREALANFS